MNKFLAAFLLFFRIRKLVINIQIGGATKREIINAKAPLEIAISTILFILMNGIRFY